jgi:hypothetical protein
LEQAISPELALVDPELARAARSRLPEPGVTSRARSDFDAAPARLTAASCIDVSGELNEQHTSRRLLIGVAAVSMLALLLFDVRVQVGERPASAVPQALEQPSSTSPLGSPPAGNTKHATSPSPRAPSRTSSRGPASRRFAWAPVEGASGYDVEFFRGATRVYAERTTTPSLEIPARWRHDGVSRSFRPGEYKWYVWPVIADRRASRASVQATISIPAG